MKKRKLNLGCAKVIMKGYDNIDFNNDLPGVNIQQDLNKHPWDIPDNTYDEVFAKFILEHTADNLADMEDLWRICKNGAIIEIYVPHQNSDLTWTGMGHKRGYNLTAFDLLEGDNDYDHYAKARFKILEKKNCGGKLFKIFEFLHIDKFLVKYFNNICSVCYFKLGVIK